MRAYELVLILKAALSEVQRKKIITTIKSWLKGAKFSKEEELGQKQLSYRIKKQTSGVYFDWNFDTESIPADFGKKILENEDILRHLLIRRK